jgi:hypothetical protein
MDSGVTRNPMAMDILFREAIQDPFGRTNNLGHHSLWTDHKYIQRSMRIITQWDTTSNKARQWRIILVQCNIHLHLSEKEPVSDKLLSADPN